MARGVFRNQMNTYSNKLVIRSNSRQSDTGSSQKKLRGEQQIVKNILNDECIRRIEKVQEAYSGEVVPQQQQPQKQQ